MSSYGQPMQIYDGGFREGFSFYPADKSRKDNQGTENLIMELILTFECYIAKILTQGLKANSFEF